jgi:hypothetical protein
MALMLLSSNTSARRLLVTDAVVCIWKIEMSVCTLRCQNNHSNDTTRASVPFDCFLQCSLDKVYRLGLGHTFPPVGIAVSVDIS